MLWYKKRIDDVCVSNIIVQRYNNKDTMAFSLSSWALQRGAVCSAGTTSRRGTMMATCVPTIFPPIVTRQTSRRTVNHIGQKIGQKRRGVGLRQGQPNLSDLEEIQPFFVLPVPMRVREINAIQQRPQIHTCHGLPTRGPVYFVVGVFPCYQREINE